ncbi:hypothetical protein [Streptomyces sp. NPDC003435]
MFGDDEREDHQPQPGNNTAAPWTTSERGLVVPDLRRYRRPETRPMEDGQSLLHAAEGDQVGG